MKLETIAVDLNNYSYSIYIGENLLADSALLSQNIHGQQTMLITNKTIAPLYLDTVKTALGTTQCDTLLLPDGEQYKTMEQLNFIFDSLAEKRHHRDTTLIALGGGVIGDITGFVAACYQRGVSFIQLPTTLLAQVDASIGGKTAVNHPLGKNLIGAFHQPKAVIIDINTLDTLPDREFKAGLAEVVKAALIKDANFFKTLEKNIDLLLKRDPHTLITTIKTACKIKRDIVIADEKETSGERALLNLGHTFGHAIEQLLGYGQWLHGEAVSVGLVLAARWSHQKTWLSESDLNRIIDLLKHIGLPTELPNHLKRDQLRQAVTMDKKVFKNKIHWVLLKGIGHAVLTTELAEEAPF